MMYWRVRRYTPEELLKLYGLHIALIVSVLLNILLFISRPNLSKTISPEVKADFDSFARKVTNHILDTSYITYAASTAALMNPEGGELTKPVIVYLQQQQQLPRDMNESKAQASTYMAKRRVCAVRVDEVNQREMDSRGMVPVDVSGVVAVHSSEEADPGPVPFHFRYLIGFRPNSQTPIVANFQDLSPGIK